MSQPNEVRMTWGPNTLTFATVDDAVAFARELGAVAVSYWPIWTYAAG